MRTGQAGAVLKRHGVMTSLTERLDGPSAIAIWGSDEPGDAFRLGTRELWTGIITAAASCSGIESGLIRLHTKQGSWATAAAAHRLAAARLHHKVTLSGVPSGWGVLPDAGREPDIAVAALRHGCQRSAARARQARCGLDECGSAHAGADARRGRAARRNPRCAAGAAAFCRCRRISAPLRIANALIRRPH